MAETLFTTRENGFSRGDFYSFNLASHVGDDPKDVTLNRSHLSKLIGIPEQDIFYMNQVHGRQVAIVDGNSHFDRPPEADALFTREQGKALVTLIADCVPLLLAAKDAIAAVHVGRQGLVAGVVDSALEIFRQHGISYESMKGYIGPSICGSCYEVDLGMYREVVSKYPLTATSEERRSLDIASGVRGRLLELGVTVESSKDCTICSPGYFSYRRDGRTGRQAGVVWL